MKQRDIIFYIALAIVCLFLACLSTNYDYDLFARLIVGERFIEEGILPFKDFLSYTPTHPWYDHEWGSGVVFYFVLKHLGAFGLLFLHAILMFGTAFFIVKTQQLQKHAYPKSLIFMVIFLYFFSHLNPTLIRCHMFTFFFFSLFIYLLESRSNKIWLIPPIVIIWNNLHGGVVSGLGLVFMYLVGALLERKPWKKYFGVLALSTPLLVINPYGYKYLDFLFSATTMTRKYITEWWNIFTPRHINYYIYSGLYGVLGLVASFRKFNITKFIVLAATLYLGFSHVKLLSLSLIATAALCYNDIFRLFRKLPLKKVEKSLYLAIFALVFAIPLFSPTYPRADFSRFPLQEVEFLQINKIKGNIVVPFGLGSYVSYKLYPDNLIYMDGRYEEVYNDKEFLTLRDYELAEPNWRDIVNNYPTEILMPLKSVEIYDVLKKDTDWVEIFEGNLCGIFVKKNSKNAHYELAPNENINYYREKMFRGIK